MELSDYPMYNLEQLRMFVEAAESGSFSASARRLGKVQSAVSQGIANLEIDLGAELFDRSTRKPTLTAAGRRLLSYARAVLELSSELDLAARALNRGHETELTLAIDPALMVPTLEAKLQAFSERFPVTELEFQQVASSDVIGLIESGRADLGLMLADPSFPRTVELCYIGNLPFSAYCHQDHPLAALSSVSVSDLTPHRQLLSRGVNKEELAPMARVSAKVWWGNDYYVLRELIGQGLGWGFLPCHLAEEEGISRGLKRLPISFDHKPWSPPVDRVMPKGRATGEAQHWLAEAFKTLLDS